MNLKHSYIMPCNRMQDMSEYASMTSLVGYEQKNHFEEDMESGQIKTLSG